eukprot:2530567-Pleurochrysis_carterae.AAC.1
MHLYSEACVCNRAYVHYSRSGGRRVQAHLHTKARPEGLPLGFSGRQIFTGLLFNETWQLSLPQPAEVLPELHSARDRRPPGTNAVTEIVLHEGEMLYLPRGMVHCCRAGDTAVPLDGLHNIGAKQARMIEPCDEKFA